MDIKCLNSARYVVSAVEEVDLLLPAGVSIFAHRKF